MPTLINPKFYSHNNSHRLYEVMSRDGDTVHYRCIGNGGSRFKLSREQFARKFSAIERPKVEFIERFIVELETYPFNDNSEVNTQLLDEVISAANSSESQVKLDELFEDCDAGPGDLVRPQASFSRIVLDSSARTEVDATVASIELRKEIDEAFNLASICKVRRSVYCLYGPPGTGKTITIHAIAEKLGKLLYQVDYGQVNGSEARRAIFKRAQRYNAILFLDEADALCAARTFWPSATAQRLNADKNVFIQALDAYDGPVLMATNLLNHFDEAFMRRVSRYVKFNLPDLAMRQSIFGLHLPAANGRIDVDLAEAATASNDLSGGDIQNVCFNAIDAACIGVPRPQWKVTTALIRTEIQKVRQAKADNLAGNKALQRGGRAISGTAGGEE